MPGAHLDLRLMQCYAGVGGCDAWLAGFWDKRSQWHTGWHLPGATGLPGLIQWSWPDPAWVLIGYERWRWNNKGEWLSEACYHYPNPSTAAPPAGRPLGHWHVWYAPNGQERRRLWSDSLLEEGELYLKGCRLGPKGGGMNKNFDKGSGKGKGPGKGQKGKGPGNGSGKSAEPKGKGGSGKGKDKSIGKGPKGSGKSAGPKGKGGLGKGKSIRKGKDDIDNINDIDDIDDMSSTSGKGPSKGKHSA